MFGGNSVRIRTCACVLLLCYESSENGERGEKVREGVDSKRKERERERERETN